MTNQDDKLKEYSLKPWEFKVLLLEMIGFGACLLTLGRLVLPQLLQEFGLLPQGGVLPRVIGAAVGFFALFWSLVPVFTVYQRHRGGEGFKWATALILSAVGSSAGGLLYAFLI